MTNDERRLPELLAGSADGCTDALLTAQGFKLDVLISIVSAEFATAQPERTSRPASRSRQLGCRSPTPAGGPWRIVAIRFSCRNEQVLFRLSPAGHIMAWRNLAHARRDGCECLNGK
jgi:hypothetical protein